jgi:non-specific serine/threonine protein kinase
MTTSVATSSVSLLQPGGPPGLLARSALPAFLTPLVGRERERASLIELLTEGRARLVTLTGAGGVGKTRLALDVTHAVADVFFGRVWYVPLASLADPSLVITSIAETLGLPAADDAETVERLRHALGGEPALLVLDNLEHLVAAAARLAAMLEACPGLRLLVTSREALRVRGEREIHLLPLTLPDADVRTAAEAAAFEAVALYVQRTRAVRPDFALTDDNVGAVVEICRRLDGLPLAIELAAARSRILPPAALVGRIEHRLSLLTGGARDLPARQQTMRDAIAWSYDLLSPEDQALFRRLSVFAGGFSMDAAEYVGGETDRRTDEEMGREDPSDSLPVRLPVFEGIASLLDKSLLREVASSDDQPRYGMLETIREFGLDRLQAAGEFEEVRRHHAVWYADLAERSWLPLYRDPVDTELLARFEIEHDNVRAALAWFDAVDDLPGLVAFTGAVGPFWYFRSHWAEGAEWLRRALRRLPDPCVPPATVARALHVAGCLTEGNPEAIAQLEESLRIWEELGDRWGAAASADVLAKQLNGQGEYGRAADFAARAILVFADTGDTVWLADVVAELGVAAFGRGRIDEARPRIEQALSLARRAGDGYGIALTLSLLAMVAGESGDVTGAAAACRESLDAWTQVGMKEGVTGALAGVATLAATLGRQELAARLFGAADHLAAAIGYRLPLPQRDVVDRARAAVRHALGDAGYDAALAAGRGLSPADAVAAAAAFAEEALTGETTSGVSAPRQRDENPAGLTRRELEVLRLLAEGRSDREIGETLSISRATAARHVANILLKLDVNSRTQAAGYAFRHGLA